MAKMVNKLMGGKTTKAAKPVPVKIVSEPMKASPDRDYEARERKWRAEEDVRTLQRAAEIQADKSRFKEAKGVASQQAKALQKVLGK